MRIAEVYSHLNGLEFLKVHKPGLWLEVETVIGAIDAGACKTKVSGEKRIKRNLLYAPIEMNKQFSARLKKLNWNESRVTYWVTRDAKLIRATMTKGAKEQKEEIIQAGETPIMSYNQTDFVKDRVALEVQFGKYSFVAYDLFVKHLAFYVRDEIDVGIEVLAMKSMQSKMSSGPAYYEGELYNVVRNGRGVPGVPLVIVGVVP
ncbi:MAG TPA: BglII/BstYI family type II restriction endonuclease [Verrucomicrobiae bacterium]|jgi:hypothetical protein|nr:BglII/BstYI family type II restriction endonuclease [Verrucomicrobiae bacterium]